VERDEIEKRAREERMRMVEEAERIEREEEERVKSEIVEALVSALWSSGSVPNLRKARMRGSPELTDCPGKGIERACGRDQDSWPGCEDRTSRSYLASHPTISIPTIQQPSPTFHRSSRPFSTLTFLYWTFHPYTLFRSG